MRDLKIILERVQDDAQRDQCSSWPVICLLAMEQAVKECKEDTIQELSNLQEKIESTL